MTEKPRVTHLTLDDTERMAAGVRAAQLRCSVSEYVGRLIREDAEQAGISDLLVADGKEADHG